MSGLKLLDQTRQAPDVKSAALTANTPLVDVSVVAVIPEGHELKRGEHAIDTTDNIVSPGYFKTIGTPLVRGRDFLDTDTANTPQVAIVNEQFASHYWPKQDPIGKRIRLHDATGKQVEVVGVAKVAKYIFISESPLDYIFLPFSQNPQGNMRMLAQSKNSNSAALVPVLRQIVQRLDRNMPVFDVRTMESLYQMRAVSTPAMITQTVTALGLMGLVLAVVGLYGVVSYTVSKRSREFGIRMAVGADRRSVVRMVLQQGLILGTAGLAVGLVLGIVVARALANSAMFSFPTNVLPFVAVSILLLLSVTFSAYVPARRASLIDPMRALREE